ncbi:MAG: GAF domain-containing protein [Chloroflexi bacterium]|nr:MAG: GAF domain-containing protein [Chloroflexota bacterium]
MVNLKNLSTQKLFDILADRWQKTVGSRLVLVSRQGVPLTANGDLPGIDWPAVVARADTQTPAYFPHPQNSIAVAPLLEAGHPVAYVAAVNAGEQETPLLEWAAETLMDRLLEGEALQNMTDELISAWNQLELVYRVTQKLTLAADLNAVLRSILSEIKRVVNTEYAFVVMQEGAGLEIVTTGRSLPGKVDYRAVLTKLLEENRVVLGDNQAQCRKYWPGLPPQVHTMLACPLEVEGLLHAGLVLVNKQEKPFTAGDAKLLDTLGLQLGVIIKNFLLHQRAITQERLRRELEIAAEIQKSMLPTHLPQVGGMSIAVSSTPASEVGGDFYDFVTLDDHHLTVIIGDVAGKGIPAAMLTSVTRTILRVEAMRGESPEMIIQRANEVLSQDLNRAESFVTVFTANIDSYDGLLTYASAGHMPAILWRADTRNIELLNATTPPLGIPGNYPPKTKTVKIQPGDTLVLYTDGITDAPAPNGNLFGLNRLLYIIRNRATEAPEKLQEYIQAEVNAFLGTSDSRDDATLLIIKLLPTSQRLPAKDISTVIKTVEFRYPADIKYLTLIAKQVTGLCRELPNLPPGPETEDFIYLVELAISEICTNVIKHAYANKEGDITGSVTVLNNGVQIDFFDHGDTFDPDTVTQAEIDPYKLAEGGYGLHIVRQIMDVVSYEHTPDKGNHWHLIKFLPSQRV